MINLSHQANNMIVEIESRLITVVNKMILLRESTFLESGIIEREREKCEKFVDNASEIGSDTSAGYDESPGVACTRQ